MQEHFVSESDNYLEAMAAPVAYTIPGVGEVSFPVCEVDDFAKWLSDVHKAKKAIANARIPKLTSDPQAQLDMYLAVEHDAPGLDAVSKQIYTPGGARKVLELSLTRHLPPSAGADALAQARAEAAAKVKKIPGRDLVRLAQQVSGLFHFSTPEDPKAKNGDGGEDENPAEEPAGDTGETGTST